MEIAVVWATLATHVTGYPSVWLRGWNTMSLCHCCFMSHTLAHTRPLLSWLENSTTDSSTTECKLHTKDNVTLFEMCCDPLSPASPLHYRRHRYVPLIKFFVYPTWPSDRIVLSYKAVLFCSRHWLLPDLQWEPQQVHKGGECHLNDGGDLWSSCQRAAIPLGFRIAHPQSVPQALYGGHGD